MKDIKILEIRHLRGPNMWTYRPVLEALVDIDELEDFPSNLIPGFYERLSAALPSLIEHRCSYGERGGFLRRVKEGTWPCHILEHCTLELQNLAGMPGGFGKAREIEKRGVYKVVVRAWHEAVTRAALYSARELIMAMIEDRPFDVDAAVANLRDLVDRHCLGPSTASIVDAADDRNIPAIRLLARGNLVQLGYGARSRRIWTAETDRTGAIAETISRDKDLTKSLLASCGVPVPEGRLVDSAEDAWDAAEDIGGPVVVKPYDGNHGRGVFIELTRREEVESAYAIALEEGSGVIVERCIPGAEHRLLVIGGRLVAANRSDMASVIGDGKQSILELIASQINADPRRGSTEDHPLNIIRLDSAARMEISRQGFTPESVPPAGQEVLIQRNGNHAFDVTDEVHPSVAAAATLAARIVGLDIAGIDLVCRDIGRPLEEQGGAIVEVNAGPSLLMHLKPAVGKPRPVGQAIVEHLFPNDDDGRIPVVGITGSRGKTPVARIVASLISLSGKCTGLACSKGLFIDRRQVEAGDRTDWDAANRMLMNRSVEAAVFENGADEILGEGLAYDRCQVAVVTNIDPALHLGRFHIDTTEKVFNVLRTQVDVVLRHGVSVLNAGDAMVAEMAPLSDGEVLWFARDAALPAVVEHRAAGGRAVLLDGDRIVLAKGEQATPLVALGDIPLLAGHRDAAQIDNLLAAIGAAWALDIPTDIIRTGVETFDVI
ncbi:cyanophycin synthetase [Rhodocyclus tenuis]|uniref:Cyanophycin synthetase n=2 Tax=Rhodocyclus TaxID=1064 RepID=A0A6L5JXL6_RHOTE|nr:cyanophycin synthetase [Rhodocyclus gracilis]MQY52073.1 cyanophycin synthetase [Rhodocyclus gracilis]MRD73690.1 cyanophycin synthetase [Rhodocyclus gracilis]NJA89666.1 cyanophycin synthetase [Rhodocyclus gracilis]